MKFTIGTILDEECDNPSFLDKWCSGRFSAAERRILMTRWVGEAHERVIGQKRIGRLFEKTGSILRIDGSRNLMNVQGLPTYTFQPTQQSCVISLDSDDDSSDYDSNDSDDVDSSDYDSNDSDDVDIDSDGNSTESVDTFNVSSSDWENYDEVDCGEEDNKQDGDKYGQQNEMKSGQVGDRKVDCEQDRQKHGKENHCDEGKDGADNSVSVVDATKEQRKRFNMFQKCMISVIRKQFRNPVCLTDLLSGIKDELRAGSDQFSAEETAEFLESLVSRGRIRLIGGQIHIL
jgi:hypothetical protein